MNDKQKAVLIVGACVALGVAYALGEAAGYAEARRAQLEAERLEATRRMVVDLENRVFRLEAPAPAEVRS